MGNRATTLGEEMTLAVSTKVNNIHVQPKNPCPREMSLPLREMSAYMHVTSEMKAKQIHRKFIYNSSKLEIIIYPSRVELINKF